MLAKRRGKLREDHLNTLMSISDLGSLLRYQGKYEAAEEMQRRVLAGREKKLGSDHPDTLTSINDLAWVLRDQGKRWQKERKSLAQTIPTPAIRANVASRL